MNNYAELNEYTYSSYGFTKVTDSSASNNPWFQMSTLKRDTIISKTYTCKGGETFRVTANIYSTAKASSSSSDKSLVDYRSTRISIYSRNADGTMNYQHGANAINNTVNTSATITLPSTARSFFVSIQIDGWPPFSGTVRVRNVEVKQMSNGELIVDGSITASKIAANTITGDKIAAGTISSTKLTVGDFTNLCNLHTDNNTNGYTVITHSDGFKYFRFGSTSTAGYYSIQFFKSTTDNFRVGDKFRIKYKGWCSAGSATIILRAYYTDNTWSNLGAIASYMTTTNSEKATTLEITAGFNANKVIKHVICFIETGNTTGYFYMRDIVITRLSTELYDGITSIDKNGITVNQSNAKSKTTMSANGFAITRTDNGKDIFRVGSNGLLTLNGVFKCYKDGANQKGARLESSGAVMLGYNDRGGNNPVFASGLWTDENMGYFSVGYTRADVSDANGCLWMSPQHGNTGCRLTYSKLVDTKLVSTNLYFQKDGNLLFSTNINGLNSTDDRYTYQFDSGVSTRALRCDNLRTYNIYPRSTGSYNLGSVNARFKDAFIDSVSTTNQNLMLGTVTSTGAWQTYGALGINSSTGYVFPHKGNGQLTLGTNSNRFHGLYSVNAVSVSSDKRAKTDIHYLDNPYAPQVIDNRIDTNMHITPQDMYDFVRDDLKLASYRYNINLDRGIISTDYGFIAQDILYTKVGSEIVQLEDKEDLDSNLSYNQGNYIATLAGALQTAIKKIEQLEDRIKELESLGDIRVNPVPNSRVK